ncbi:MAG TPA: tyrosine-type recombinase/integrase [Rhodopila sp.]
MPWPKKSKPKAERVVRHKLRDGTVKEYRYKAFTPARAIRKSDTLAALIDAYRDSPEWQSLAASTKTNYAIYLRPLEKIGQVDPATIRRRDILTLRDSIASARGTGAATGFVRAASTLFRWAVDREWVEHSPVTKIRPLDGGHLTAWTPQQAATAISELPPHLRRVVILALYTGQRRGDLCSLGWSSYDGSRIRLVQEKTRTPLVLPVHPALKAELDLWPKVATTILANTLGRPWKPELLSHAMHTGLARIGLPGDLNIHGIRKLAAANLADAGCSVHEIAAITGHASLSMVQFYTRTADQERLAGAAILRLGNLQKPTNDKLSTKRHVKTGD